MIRAINVISNFPYVEWDTSIMHVVSFYDVFYHQDIVMYRFNYGFDSLINGKLLLRESRKQLFIFHKDSIYGYEYFVAPNHPAFAGRLLVDSILKVHSYRDNRLDSLLNFECDTSFFDDQKNLVKIYNPPVASAGKEKFTVYLYYTRDLKDIPETFSKKMDNVENMKLFKARIAGHGIYNEQYKMAFPPRESSFEIREIQAKNEKEILAYFNKYEKEHLKD